MKNDHTVRGCTHSCAPMFRLYLEATASVPNDVAPALSWIIKPNGRISRKKNPRIVYPRSKHTTNWDSIRLGTACNCSYRCVHNKCQNPMKGTNGAEQAHKHGRTSLRGSDDENLTSPRCRHSLVPQLFA